MWRGSTPQRQVPCDGRGVVVNAKALDVYVDAKQQARFRRRALRAFHKNQEYAEAIFIRRGLGEFYVERFVPLHITKADTYIVEYDDVHCAALKNEAHILGLEFGTIHTHVVLESGSAPSKHDHTDGVKEGETLVGVCEIEQKTKGGRVRLTMDFWQPQLPAVLHVVKSRKK